MGGMTVPQFSRPGAVDLSALARKAAPPASGQPRPAGSGSFTFDVTDEQSLRTDVVEQSMSVVVLVSFWSEQSAASKEINATLTALADEYGGRFVLARIDAGAQPQLVQALGIPAVPLVVAALRGQLAPLIQEPLPEPEMRQLIDQILQAAAANGVTGVAAPVAGADETTEEPAEPESRFPAADEALMAGDLDRAIAEYESALSTAPGDAEASVGLARARLLKRTQGVDLSAARAAAADNLDDVPAQTLVADLDLMGGHVEDAFSRLVDLVRRTRDADREAARAHLVEMFAVVGDDDPRVAKARQMLASALF
jgi:putative thioredoxin